MTLSRAMILTILLALPGCGRKSPGQAPAPVPVQVDSVWALAEAAFNRGDWSEAQKHLDRATPLLPPADPRYLRLHFYLAEILFAQGSPLQAVREFRRIADERPDDPLAPDALLRAGDAYLDLWRRPELDPTYGETARRLSTALPRRSPRSAALRLSAHRLAGAGARAPDRAVSAPGGGHGRGRRLPAHGAAADDGDSAAGGRAGPGRRGGWRAAGERGRVRRFAGDDGCRGEVRGREAA
jgi:tetratricopeptide (TPR) repeat protein